MGYNPFRWWTKGRPNKPLNADAPLLLKIRNGDFDYSYMFNEAASQRALSKEAYDQAYKNYGGTDEKNRNESALEAGRMKRIKAIKLEIEANRDENMILWRLQKEFTEEFGKDLWEKALERQRGGPAGAAELNAEAAELHAEAAASLPAPWFVGGVRGKSLGPGTKSESFRSPASAA
jgi:hypothetical protein